MSRKGNPFSITSRLRSFGHAFNGFKDMLLTEHNAWIHALATILALDFAWWLKVDRSQFAIIVITAVIVWVAEAFNTVLEMMANLVAGQRYSVTVKRAKDIAAAAVLGASIGALTVGIVILGPPFWDRVAPFGFPALPQPDQQHAADPQSESRWRSCAAHCQ